MKKSTSPEEFGKLLLKQLTKDTDQITQQLADFIDENVIRRKFEQGFPGHKLTPAYAKKKGSSKVGVNTGKLRAAATAFTNWQLYASTPGALKPALIKGKKGLTAYSEKVKTKIGGELDYLALNSQDLINVGNQARTLYARKNYQGSGKLKFVKREK